MSRTSAIDRIWNQLVSEEDTRAVDTVRAAAFQELLAAGEPVSPATVAHRTDLDEAAVAQALVQLEQDGRLVRDSDSLITGCAGLSVTPTRHEIRIGDRRRWTWCAVDALGILAALEADGRITSLSPQTDAPVTIEFAAGRPEPSGAALFIASPEGVQTINQDWCPNVNLFISQEEAAAWVAGQALSGNILTVQEATDLIGDRWRICLGEQPSGPPCSTDGCCA